MKKICLFAILALMLAVPASAKKIYDPLGRAHEVDNATAITPGAGSGLGAIVGIAVDSTLTYVRRDVDVFFTTGPLGTTSDPTQQRPFLGMGALYYLNETMSVGIQLGRPDLTQAGLWQIRPVAKFYLGYDYTDHTLKAIKFSPGGYSIATTQETSLDGGGAWSFDPTLAGCMELPVKYGTIGIEGGVGYAFTQYDQNIDQAFLLAALTMNLFAVRSN